MIKLNNKNSLALTFLSFFMLVPGLYLPMLTISMKGKIISNITNLDLNIFNKSSSILKTIKDLFENNQYLVSFLILLFSVMIPFFKGLLIIYSLYIKDLNKSHKIFLFIKNISKWSMADVFVVAIFLCYLSAQTKITHTDHEIDVFGMRIAVNIFFEMFSTLNVGFYFFLSYCFLSNLALQFYKDPLAKNILKNY